MSTLDNPNLSGGNATIGPTIIRYGLLGGLIFVIYGLIGNLAGFARPSAGFGALGINILVSMILYVGLMVFAIRHFRDNENGGYINFGKAFAIGLGVAVLAGVISSIFTYIYAAYIEPDYFETILQETEVMYERFNMSEEQIEQAMEQARKSMTPTRFVTQSLIGNLIFGAIIAAITGAVMKKNPPQF
jgi:hypothetical protein